MPRWLKVIITMAALAALCAGLWFAFVMYVVLFGDWRWGPS
jgi:hypothetical protein